MRRDVAEAMRLVGERFNWEVDVEPSDNEDNILNVIKDGLIIGEIDAVTGVIRIFEDGRET